MSDLIRREDAFSKFENVCTSYFVDKNGMKRGEIKTALTWEGIRNILESIPSIEPERRWIPVTEALPINDVNVIVSILDDFGDTPYRFTSVGWCTPDGQYWVVNNEICYGVIAWMPLPEPYRGE